MKSKAYLFLLIAALCAYTVNAQDQKFSKKEAAKILNTYKKNSRIFLNLETCGDAYDGPIYLLKKSENYSLDRMIRITPQEEADLGSRIFNDNYAPLVVKNSKDLPMIQGMIAKIGRYTARPNMVYHIYIINSDEVNAYSTIGGYIYVTTGMLGFVKSKDELAFVLAHEISHIVNNHVVRKIKKIALITSLGHKFNYERFSQTALSLNNTLSAPFDQIDEYDADRSALTLVKKAGYDQMAFNSFFTELETSDRKDLLSKFMATHPSADNRRRCLNNLISK